MANPLRVGATLAHHPTHEGFSANHDHPVQVHNDGRLGILLTGEHVRTGSTELASSRCVWGVSHTRYVGARSVSNIGGYNQERKMYSLQPIGYIRSRLRELAEAPRQGSEGAPDAWLEVNPSFEKALSGIVTGDELMIVTWLHLAKRDVLEVHPRGDPEIPLAGVFATRSPHRPNPLGLHRVTVREISGTRLRIGPIEAIDGTPVIDVKPVLVEGADA
jgi:tRNA-Thr(GGU) m(6)t(6)A37 methyltransferase TsaA